MPNNLTLSRTIKTTSKVCSLHTQSLHYMNVEQLFTCLNCIPPIKFHCAKLNRSVTCHFLLNNLHFITFSNRIIQPIEKGFTWNKMLLLVNFFLQFSCVLTFSTNQMRFQLPQTEPHRLLIPCKQLVFYHVFHTQGVKSRQVTTNQGALLRIYSFNLCSLYLHSFKERRSQYIGSTRDTVVSVCFSR